MATDPGVGPPRGSYADAPGAPRLPLGSNVYNGGGLYQGAPPADVVTAPSIGDVKRIYKDLPLVTIQNTWSVEQVRGALSAHMLGQFDASAQLCDSILGDDRVRATMGSRVSGLFGRPVRIRPANTSAEARECADAWSEVWPRLSGDSALRQIHTYTIMMGWDAGQVVWDTTADLWCPYVRPWHPRFTYYDWTLRRYVAMSQDGSIPIVGGDGKWLLHAPHGEYRGWIFGGIRPVAEPWMLRHFAFRDMARFSEIHGLPIRRAYTPAAADPVQRAQFEAQLANLGNETTILIAKGVDEHNSYDFDLCEAGDMAWEVFPGLIDRCDAAIVLALLFQNLTTEVKGGSFAATDAHMDIRESGIQDDAAAWKHTIRTQLARPFAFLNFGDADLAPWTEYDVTPRSEYKANGEQLDRASKSIAALTAAGVRFESTEELRSFLRDAMSLDSFPAFTLVEPKPAAPVSPKEDVPAP